MKLSETANQYIGGLTHVHTVLSNHPSHHESNLTIDRVVQTLDSAGLAGSPEAPLQYVLLNEHPSDPARPRRLGRLSLRGRRLLQQRRRPVIGRVPVFYGLEVSLLPGSRTDLTPRLADHCPLVIGSRHALSSTTERDPAAITELFHEACVNPAVEVIGHPPRYIEDLPQIDWPQIFAWAKETGTAIEINLNIFPPATADTIQLAFWPTWLRQLAQSGAYVVIGTDLHNQLQLDGFVSQWHELDESAGHEDNQLARFLEAIVAAKIRPSQVVTSSFDRFESWLAIDKAERARLR